MSALETTDLEDVILDGLRPVDAPDDWAIEGDAEHDSLRTWRPTDADRADWVARKAQKAQRTVDSLQAQRDRLVAQADAWLAQERTRHDRTIAWAESMLRLWLEAEIAADESSKPKKSRTLPSGVTVKRTAGGKSLVVEDEQKLLEWLDDNYPELVTYTPKKAEVKKLLTGDGVAVPGVSIDVAPDGFKVELGGDA